MRDGVGEKRAGEEPGDIDVPGHQPLLTCADISLCLPLRSDARQGFHPNLSLDRSLAFSASISRSRACAWVCSDASKCRAEAVTSATARSNASALACDGLLKPESFLTNCSAEAGISSSVAGGSKLNSVLMLRHICLLLCPTRGYSAQGRSTESKTYIAGSFWHRMDAAFTPRHGRVPANQRVLH